jgi:prepilin-type N-terminal cleavage/methylation domain-containing protein
MQMRKMRRRFEQPAAGQRGFTLVEIAIVLVIIGLLLGGILKGQEMITQAKIKNVVNDFNGITAAINSYQDRYKALPGDDLNAGTRWQTVGTVQSGNGNGQWDKGGASEVYNNVPSAAASSSTPEVNLFWWHLRLAGFVGGTTDPAQISSIVPPNNAANGLMGVQTGGMGFTSNVICSSNLPDKIAIAVDTQMDDGTSTSGQVRGNYEAAPSPPLHTPVASAPTAGDQYVESGTYQYVLCKNL